MQNKTITTSLGGIELTYDKEADFPLSIDGNLLYASDIKELYMFLKEIMESCDHKYTTVPEGNDGMMIAKCLKCNEEPNALNSHCYHPEGILSCSYKSKDVFDCTIVRRCKWSSKMMNKKHRLCDCTGECKKIDSALIRCKNDKR